MKHILGIETSCDEAGVALVGEDGVLKAHALASHIDVCRRYGGVVPEMVAREHARILPVLLKDMMAEHCVKWSDISSVAVTAGPGLMGSLIIGCAFARGISRAHNIPLCGINHLQGHVLVARLENDVRYPFLALLVSGGHTVLYRVERADRFIILGQTYDDALGEAFDKVARMLGIPYPGGAQLEKLALNGRCRIPFPMPMVHRPNLDFSFSGLKASVARFVEQQKELTDAMKADIAFSFQEAAVGVVAKKIQRAIEEHDDVNAVVLTGGVAANSRLRHVVAEHMPGDSTLYYPRPALCTDNGVMIAWAAYELSKSPTLLKGEQVVPNPNMAI